MEAVPLDLVYLVSLGGLCLVGLHRLVLLVSSFGARSAPTAPPWRPGPDAPFVTVQLPVYNERFVVEPLLEAVGELEYPAGRLEVQILDDSDDETVSIAAQAAERLRLRGLRVEHVRRPERVGFKAGALAQGLKSARGELLAIFDADFLPPPDFLIRSVPLFADPAIGLVQARWDHTNRHRSLLTRAQAAQLDGHFLVEHSGRQQAGLFLNFNGTAGILRRTAIEQAGGWQSETLTEDLDLSCRAQLAGWRFCFRPDLVVPAQLPEPISAYKTQQRRWTRGSLQTARKLLGPLWRSRLALRQKLEATALLVGNLAYVLFFAFAILHAARSLLSDAQPAGAARVLDTYGLGLATAVLVVFYATAAVRAGRGIVPAILEVPALLALGAGMAPNNALAALAGLLGPGGTFHRTPKMPLAGRPMPRHKALYRAALGPATWLELPLAAGAFATALALFARGWPGSALFYALFGAGLACVGAWSLAELLPPQRASSASDASPAETAPYCSATTHELSAQSPSVS
jgi:hypothetical protein